MFVSIIIPVYNTKIEYVDNIIENICSQTCSDYEVIFVDDGSEKKIADSLDDMLIKLGDSRFNVIHQKNEGVSSARNAGIAIAKGDYLAFIDADDLIVPNYIQDGYDYVKKYQPDVIFGQMIYSRKREINNLPEKANEKATLFEENRLQDVKRIYFQTKNYKKYGIISGSVCASFFRKEVLEDCEFDIGVTHLEDQLFVRKILQRVKRVLLVEKVWYIYWQNDKSAMHDLSEKPFEDLIVPYWDKLIEINKFENSELEVEILVAMMNEFTAAVGMAITSRKNTLCQCRKIVKKLRDHPLMKDSFASLKINFEKMEKKEVIKLIIIRCRMYTLLILLIKYTQSKLATK